jgi:hypothetical protein
VTAKGHTEVFEAARAGDLAAVLQRLHEAPEALDARDASGASLLHVAAERDDVALARSLLELGADPEVEAPWGQTPYEWAANLNAARVADMLRYRGVDRHSLWTAAALGRMDDVRRRLDDGPTGPGFRRGASPEADLSGWPEDTAFRRGDGVSDAFYIACRNGHLAVARALAEAGASLDARGYFGGTALHWAALGGHAAVVRWLVRAGARADERDPKFDSTPAGWAREGGHTGLARLLDEAPAEASGDDLTETRTPGEGSSS